ncbi:hypothetical protein Hdeb2414_s0012g00384031 [Helianthus debilis subsp. tardiflorus]
MIIFSSIFPPFFRPSLLNIFSICFPFPNFLDESRAKSVKVLCNFRYPSSQIAFIFQETQWKFPIYCLQLYKTSNLSLFHNTSHRFVIPISSIPIKMTVEVTPLPEKINPDPDHKTNVDADNDRNRFPFHLLIMMPTTIGSFVRSYHRKDSDYSMAVFSLLVFSVFILVDYFLVWFIALPKNEKSSQKFWLKVTMWFLYTGISFMFVYLYSFFLSSQITVALYALMFICTAFLLSKFIITDIIGDWKIMRDAGKSNHAYSVLEKV